MSCGHQVGDFYGRIHLVSWDGLGEVPSRAEVILVRTALLRSYVLVLLHIEEKKR